MNAQTERTQAERTAEYIDAAIDDCNHWLTMMVQLWKANHGDAVFAVYNRSQEVAETLGIDVTTLPDEDTSSPSASRNTVRKIIAWLKYTRDPQQGKPAPAKPAADFVSPVSQAVAHMTDHFKRHHSLMPEKEIERLVGRSRKTLAKSQQYRLVRQSIKDQMRAIVSPGYKDDEGSLDCSEELPRGQRRCLRGPRSDD